MTNVDQFESMFRAAARGVSRIERNHIGSVLVVTDPRGAASWAGLAPGPTNADPGYGDRRPRIWVMTERR